MPEDFYRIKRLPPYVFSEVNALKAQARAAGLDMDGLGARMLARKQELIARFEADGLPSPETRTFTGHDLEMSAPVPVEATGNA